ncbi:MAG: transcriptional regulator [Chitinophagaceae bacterium]|nr:MAG: transcriptional regulator [Chitinophagaceae bacterium]
MDSIHLETDIPLLCLEAASFPDGVLRAHEELQLLVPPARERSYFGLSRPGGRGGIVYRAAAEQLSPEEAVFETLERIVLRRGHYLGRFVPDFRKDVSVIGNTFRELLRHPALDPQGYCVEWYGEDAKNVTLLVRLRDDGQCTHSG